MNSGILKQGIYDEDQWKRNSSILALCVYVVMDDKFDLVCYISFPKSPSNNILLFMLLFPLL